MNQHTLWHTPPKAKHTDPETSHQAARSVGPWEAKQIAILTLFRNFGQDGFTNEKLVEAYRDLGMGLPWQSDSGIRSRKAELVKQGRIIDSGERRKTIAGRNAIVWRLNTGA